MPDTLPFRWQPNRTPDPSVFAAPPMLRALLRGLGGTCPVCGKGHLFIGWLRVTPACSVCAAPLGQINADDAPPYFTVFIVAHLAIGALVAVDRAVSLSIATEMLIFLPSTLALTLLLIRPVKGATVGLMMKLGFMKTPDEQDDG